MAKIEISQEAAEFLKKRFTRPNVIVYRDIESVSGCSRVFGFNSKVKVLDGKEPNEYFTIVGNSKGIPIWVENALASTLLDASAIIFVRKGLLKGLKLEFQNKARKEHTFSR